MNSSMNPVIDSKPKTVVIFDTETNGLNSSVCDLLSIGWIKINITGDVNNKTFKILEHVEYYIKNESIHNDPWLIENVNHITDEYRNSVGKDVLEVLDKFKESIKDAYVYAYNVKFDVAFTTKYDSNLYNETAYVGDIMNSDMEGVIGCLQRMSYEYNNKFNLMPRIESHLHSAFDDVYAELLIYLHDYEHVNVRKYLVQVPDYQPMITYAPHKHLPMNEFIKHPEYVKMFFERTSEFDSYLREYVRNYIDYINYQN